MHKFALPVFAALVALAVSVGADTWSMPERRKYHSPNKKFYVEITPKRLDSQLAYFKDKAGGRGNAGAAKGVADNHCKAEFYARRPRGGYERRASFRLVNEVSPVEALVSDDGRYVVTFDNWHAAGYGPDVVVIYRSDGTLVKQFGLADLLHEADISFLPATISSIWWRGKPLIDAAGTVLTVKVVADSKFPPAEPVKYHDLKIDLATGQPLGPKPHIFTGVELRVWSVAPPADQGQAGQQPTPASKPCLSPEEEAAAAPSLLRPSAEELQGRVTKQPFPRYPAVARATRTVGTVTVEVLILEDGTVGCARAVEGHPLLRPAAAAAARQWVFAPFESSGRRAKALGLIAFKFGADEGRR